jgi:hypothetical protein
LHDKIPHLDSSNSDRKVMQFFPIYQLLFRAPGAERRFPPAAEPEWKSAQFRIISMFSLDLITLIAFI